MVKKCFLFLIILCCISCNQLPKCYYLIRSDKGVALKNYLIPDTIPFDASVLSDKINFDTFDAGCIPTTVNLKKLEGKTYRYLLEEYIASEEEFYKNLMGDDYMRIGTDSTSHDVELFFCGKLTLQPGIQSLVVLKQESDLYKNNLIKSLILYNIKNNRLCSIITLSTKFGTDTAAGEKSYLMQRDYFTQVKVSLLNGYIPEQLLSKLKIKDENSKVLYYSQFEIDKNGFIKFINI